MRRWLADLGAASLPEFTLASGRRADVIALFPDGSLTIVEIKSCAADFRADRKWTEYRDHCDRFFFAVDERFPCDLLPPETGLIVADAYGAAEQCVAQHHPLNAARRKAVLLRFARQAAMTLHALHDPAMLSRERG